MQLSLTIGMPTEGLSTDGAVMSACVQVRVAVDTLSDVLARRGHAQSAVALLKVGFVWLLFLSILGWPPVAFDSPRLPSTAFDCLRLPSTAFDRIPPRPSG